MSVIDMKYRDLPERYKKLVDQVDPRVIINQHADHVQHRFLWSETEQGTAFWRDVQLAKDIKELPEIPKE
jgi:uncharacterized protein (DUF2249 family)